MQHRIVSFKPWIKKTLASGTYESISFKKHTINTELTESSQKMSINPPM